MRIPELCSPSKTGATPGKASPRFIFSESFVIDNLCREAKDFLIEQERVEDVQLEGKTFKGKFAEFPDQDDAKPKKNKKKKDKKKKKKDEL